MANKKRRVLWQAKYILEGMPLPKDAPTAVDCFSFERLSGKEFRSLWLPALAKVEFEAEEESKNIPEIGRRLLQDFLGLFIVEVNYAIRIVRDYGYESKTRTPALKAMPPIELRLKETIPPTVLEEKMKISNKNLKTLDFSAKRNSYLRVALDYLLYSGESSRKEEKLVNLVISLETLFLKELDELGYRISMRVASLLGENDEQSAQIFQDMRDIYDERCKIVHMGYSPYGDAETWRHIRKARELARNSIKKLLLVALEHDKTTILETLDKAIFYKEEKIALFGT